MMTLMIMTMKRQYKQGWEQKRVQIIDFSFLNMHNVGEKN